MKGNFFQIARGQRPQLLICSVVTKTVYPETEAEAPGSETEAETEAVAFETEAKTEAVDPEAQGSKAVC